MQSKHLQLSADCLQGAFTPGCQAYHLPPYIQKASEFKRKGVDIIAVIASNDAWVMNAWGKVNKVSGDDIVRICPIQEVTRIVLTTGDA